MKGQKFQKKKLSQHTGKIEKQGVDKVVKVKHTFVIDLSKEYTPRERSDYFADQIIKSDLVEGDFKVLNCPSFGKYRCISTGLSYLLGLTQQEVVDCYMDKEKGSE